MDAPMDSDEEDSFVTLGTPLEIYEDDEARKKPVSVSDLPAKDSRGRPRFHGAFTGGFSAGFFNTVGSKEGFRPSSFLSSRSSKEEMVAQRPEDFMDDEDFGEHGIAPRKLATSSTYTSEERGQKRKVMTAAALAGSSVIPGVADALTDLIIPDSIPIGVSLLRKMGWKEGQGVGPRARKKTKKKKRNSELKKASSVKVYGCALPQSSSSVEESDDEALQNVTFAPKDRNPVSLKAKDNVHGLGYSGLNPRNALPSGHINLFSPPPVKGKGRRGIQGHAFGVGALEDDDEDIYATDHMSNYDMTMGSEEKDDKFGWTAPGHREKGKQQVPVGYVGKLLEGFNISSKSLKPKKVFKHPPLPPGFRLVHKFLKPCASASAPGSTDKHNAVSRGLVLGETPIFKSVFDLIPKDEQKKLEMAKDTPLPGPLSPTAIIQGTPGHKPQSDSQPDREHAVHEVAPGPTQALNKGSLTFQPFARNQDKQRRYDKYLSNFRQGNKDPFEEVGEGSMTEWEMEREKEEFARAAKLYKPLSTMMATRFTTAKYADDLDTVEMPVDPQVEQSDQAKAVEMKMFGKLTREQLEWHPDKLLCQRFNVPHPYPGSTMTGLTCVKRDKYSVFNFLEFSGTHAADTEQHSSVQEPVKAIESKESSCKQTTRESASQKHDMKSGTTGHKSSVRPAFSSIFSVLYEDDDKKQKVKQSHMEQERVTESVGHQREEERGDTVAQPATTAGDVAKDSDAPTLDLFRAIFKNSDSEDSSSESEQEQSETLSEPVATKESSSEVNAEIHSGDGKLPVTQDTSSHTPHYLPGAPVAIETVQQRLSPVVPETPQSEDEMAYGPALPPPPGCGRSVSATASSSSQPGAGLTHTAHRQHRHKHKDRSSKKHKKEKKAKNKKSKYKKEKKKRRRKKRTERNQSSSEDSNTSSSESDTAGTSDHQILERLKSVGGGGGRLKAADFM
ncbi:LOW QUALITY PROTEIN: G patch domain-containing protein 1-like [Haliotis rubra]|uniref:LOW QUALITY PROTEIN: G patch domain-containing protein 1-like n=1 Tax=Haliotis rubra TaxID=36100 RepID=UPI001EE5ECA7|nr:LOW QUALITY PROTEIN: G patch domain-containing protein 1-like [Haliotis rubra]